MKNRKLLLIVSLVLALTMSLGGTLAYLQDTDSEVNVMTLGNVQIEQIELQRKEGVAHNATATGNELEAFKVGQSLYPAYPHNNKSTDYSAEQTNLFKWGPYVTADSDAKEGTAASNGLWNDDNLTGALDKFVFVKNTGDSDCYYRTIIAFECPEGMEYSQGPDKEFMMNINMNSRFTWTRVSDYIMVNDVRYLVYVAQYNPVLPAGKISRPSLLQVVMTHNATSEDMKLLGENYEIIALTQACQTVNMPDDAATALNVAFGEATPANVAEWLGGVAMPDLYNWYGVTYVKEGEIGKIISNGGTETARGIFEYNTDLTEVIVGEGIEVLGNRTMRRMYNLKSAKLPSTLTTIDESAFSEAGITSIEIPENVTFIGKTAFGQCLDLEKIVIKSKDVTFANYVARNCPALKEVYIYSDSVTFEAGSMFFTNQESGQAHNITFYVSSQTVADALYSASKSSQANGMLIKSLDGNTTFYNTLK